MLNVSRDIQSARIQYLAFSNDQDFNLIDLKEFRPERSTRYCPKQINPINSLSVILYMLRSSHPFSFLIFGKRKYVPFFFFFFCLFGKPLYQYLKKWLFSPSLLYFFSLDQLSSREGLPIQFNSIQFIPYLTEPSIRSESKNRYI
ncbi:hypothetical protein CROQUDRAFT_626107 [Cronartium quercuum f. sp. fusiforme G11]|uniref:Uncharacterized protein n=1 Tax=Cronartium quercuum f. sp. fusiforme G11 TaxID=708437 RepID=A0A9P6NIX3_9BASI|nr:hypothetical protein CROQUDRAFT_626107 [Cronartium quercuum f. sp. fusiforme G11]